jgi:hypothetical protein
MVIRVVCVIGKGKDEVLEGEGSEGNKSKEIEMRRDIR